MERLSREGAPRGRYTAVVVGTGYGGASAASRLARARPKMGPKPTVCVLERGREWGLGEFPDTNLEALSAMQVDLPDEHLGSPLALFDFRVNEEMNVLIGCGLGGTSLINANVSIEPEPRVFADGCWPEEIRREAVADGPLRRGFLRARQMLKPVPYPDSNGGLPLPKLEVLREAATCIGERFEQATINVNFDDQVNHVGVFQPACNRCGDCVSGCNTGAKNTLMMNYLPDAKRHGAEIFTEIEVRYIEKEEDGWTVHYAPVGRARSRFDAPEMFVRADLVVLAAGSLGTTEILLRSRDRGLEVSKYLGRGFTGNGDVLGFGYNNDVPVNGVGFGTQELDETEAPGPCITGIIDVRRADRPLDEGIIIEEGVIPGALGPSIPAALALAAAAVGKDTDAGAGDLAREKLREVESLVRGPRTGAVFNTQTYLVMGHDGSDGVMRLDDNDRLRISWPGVGEREVFRRINRRLAECTAAHGGTYVKSPTWTKLAGHDLVTVHPLGGCGMASTAARGVVNHAGQVFSSAEGTAVYDSLYVTDGAVIPRSIGVNPLLTISALAERTCELLAAARGWDVDYETLEPREGSAPVEHSDGRHVGVRFTETMTGEFFSGMDTPDPTELGRRRGSGTPMEFTLTVDIDDVDAMIDDPEHPGRLHGSVTASALSSTPLVVPAGTFNLFVRVPSDPPETRRMRYRFDMETQDGRGFRFEGNKLVHDEVGFDAWPDLTTLFVSVKELDLASGSAGRVVGCALLRIEVDDFRRQLQTMSATNAPNRKQALAAVAKFGAFFSRTVFDVYGGIFVPPTVANGSAAPRKRRPLRAPEPYVHGFSTDDGKRLRLTRYQAGAKGPVLLAHGLGVSSRIFSIDTIDTNLVEFLALHGYDVWLLDYRASVELPTSKEQFSGDDIAQFDYPAAVKEVRRLTGATSVQLLGHCFGASTLTMSLLAGLEDVRSVVISQVSLDVVAPPLTRTKTGLYLPEALANMGIDRLDAAADTGEGWAGRLYDRVLGVQPVPGEERCKSATCHRITFMYAPLYEHDQLNDATHRVLHEMFGEANIQSFMHLGEMVRAGKLVNAKGEDVYAPHFDRLNLPITFIHGEENACFLPESTRRTYERLRETLGRRQYRRHVIPDYGHIDCMFGKNAARDVFPYIVEALDTWQ